MTSFCLLYQKLKPGRFNPDLRSKSAPIVSHVISSMGKNECTSVSRLLLLHYCNSKSKMTVENLALRVDVLFKKDDVQHELTPL